MRNHQGIQNQRAARGTVQSTDLRQRIAKRHCQNGSGNKSQRSALVFIGGQMDKKTGMPHRLSQNGQGEDGHQGMRHRWETVERPHSKYPGPQHCGKGNGRKACCQRRGNSGTVDSRGLLQMTAAQQQAHFRPDGMIDHLHDLGANAGEGAGGAEDHYSYRAEHGIDD